MATQLFLRYGPSNNQGNPGINRGVTSPNRLVGSAPSGWQPMVLMTTRGSIASQAGVTIPTVAGPTNGLEVGNQTNGSNPFEWISLPLAGAVTISGTITLNLWANEINMTDNVAINCLIDRMDDEGNIISRIATTARTTEVALTTAAVNNFTVTPTSTNMVKGDRIRVVVYFDDAGTMGAGGFGVFRCSGPTAAADGDSYISFNETFSFMTTEPSGSTLYLTNTAGPAVGSQTEYEMWTSRGSGVQSPTVTITAGPITTPIQWTDTTGGTAIEWYSKPLNGFTLDGLVRTNLRAKSTAANNGIRAELAICNGDGSGAVIWAANNLIDTFSPGGDVQTSPAADAGGAMLTSGTEGLFRAWLCGAATAVTDGQRLRLRIYADDATFVAAAGTGTLYYNGTTANASGDAWIQLPQTVSEVPSPTLASCRFYNDGTETGSTAAAAQDAVLTGLSVDSGDVNLGLRIRLQLTTAVATVSTDDWQLQYQRNSSGWNNVASGADIAAFNSANLTDAAATTNRLTGGTGTFVAGKVSEDGLVDDLGWSASNFTEVLYSFTVKAAGVTNGDSIAFRILRNGTVITSSTNPTITITKTVPAVTQAAYRFYADGTETGSTALAAQDTAPTVDVGGSDVNLQLRARLQSTNAAAIPSTDDWQLQVEKNASGLWSNVGSYAVVDSELAGTATDSSLGVSNTYAQSFLGTGNKLAKFSVYLKKVGTPATTTITAKLYAHTGTFGTTGTPTGSVLATSTNTVSVASLTTSYVLTDFVFDNSYLLVNGTAYCIQLDVDTASANGSNAPFFQLGQNANHAGIASAQPVGGGSWTVQAGFDMRFQLTVLTSETLADSYAETNSDTLDQVWNDTTRTGIGQSFTGNGQLLSRVEWWLPNSGGTTPGNVTARLYAHSGTFGTSSVPTGAALVTVTKAAGPMGTAAHWESFDFGSTFTLVNGTNYVITLEHAVAATGSTLTVGTDTTSPTHAGNACVNTGSWAAVSGSDRCFRVYTAVPVVPYASASLTEGAATTNRLTGGTGTFVAGEISEDALADDLGWGGNNYTEVLYSLTLQKATLVASDTLRFRILRNGVTTSMTYTVTPTINVTKTNPATITQAAFQFFNDDATPASATAAAVQNAALYVSDVDAVYQLRMRIQNTDSINSLATHVYVLQSRTNGGAWGAPVGGASPNFVGPIATTNRLTGGSGSFITGEATESTATAGATASQLTAGNYTEHVWMVGVAGTALVNPGDLIEYRVLRGVAGNEDTSFVTYSVTPSIIVGAILYLRGIASGTDGGRTPGIHRGTNSTKLDGTASGWHPALMSETRGILATGGELFTANSVTGPTNGIEATSTFPVEWLSMPVALDVTITRQIVFRLWASEGSLSANAAVNAILERVDKTGAIVSTIAQTSNTTELTTTAAVTSLPVTPTSTTMVKGDRFRLRVYFDDAGTMATGFTLVLNVGCATAGSSGDSAVTFADSIQFQTTEPTGSVWYLTDTAGPDVSGGSTVAEKEMWTSRGGSATNAVRGSASTWAAPLQWTTTNANTTAIEWYSKQVNAFTLDGLVRVNLRAREANTAANGSIRAELAICDNDGSNVVVWGASTIIDSSSPGVASSGTTNTTGELATTEQAVRGWLAGPATAVADGKRLRLRVYLDDTSSAAMTESSPDVGYDCTLTYNGPSAGASGDTWIQLPQTVTEYAPISITGYRFFNDDGSLTASTAIAADNTNISLADADKTIQFRMQLSNPTAASSAVTYYLQRQINGGAWADAGATTGITSADSPNYGNGATVTSSRIAGGVGTFGNGTACDGVGNYSATPTIAANGYTEVVYTVKLVAADVVGGDVISLRLVNATSVPLATAFTMQVSVVLADKTVSAYAPVGFATSSSGNTVSVSTSASVDVGIQTECLPRVEPTIAARSLVGAITQSSTAIAAWSVTSTAYLGIQARATALVEFTVTARVAVGIRTQSSTARPEFPTLAATKVGIAAVSSIAVENLAISRVHVGIALRSPPDSQRMLDTSVAEFIDSGGQTLGMRFTVTTAGQITHIRYNNQDPRYAHILSIYTQSDQVKRATVTDPSGGVEGWREIALATPLLVSAGVTYVTSYTTGAADGAFGWNAVNPTSLSPYMTAGQSYAGIGQDVYPNIAQGADFHTYNDVVFQPSGAYPEIPFIGQARIGIQNWSTAGAAADVTTSAYAPVGISARSAPTTEVTTTGRALVGVFTQSSTAIAAWSVISSVDIGIQARSTYTPEVSAAGRALLGITTQSPSPTMTVSVVSQALLGIAPQSSPLAAWSVSNNVALVGIQTRSAVTPTVSAVSQVLIGIAPQSSTAIAAWSVTSNVAVGIQTRSTVTPEVSFTGRALVGVNPRSAYTATADITTTSVVRVGIQAQVTTTPTFSLAVPAPFGVVTSSAPNVALSVGSNVYVGILQYSVVSAASDIAVTSTLPFGVQLRSAPTMEVSATGRLLFGTQEASGGAIPSWSLAVPAPVGIQTRSSPLAAWQVNSSAPFGVQARSTYGTDYLAASALPFGVALRSTYTPEITPTSRLLVGVQAQSTVSIVGTITTTSVAQVGLLARSAPSVELLLNASAPVGIQARSAPTYNPSIVSSALIGVQGSNSTYSPQVSAAASGLFGIFTQSAPSAQVTTTSSAPFGVQMRATVAASGDVGATSLLEVGVIARSTGNTISVIPNAAGYLGIQPRSAPTAEITTTSLAKVGVQVRSTPTAEVTTTSRSLIGIQARSGALIEYTVTSRALVGIAPRTTFSPAGPISLTFSVALAANGKTQRQGTIALTANVTLSVATGKTGRQSAIATTAVVTLAASGRASHSGTAAPMSATVTLSVATGKTGRTGFATMLSALVTLFATGADVTPRGGTASLTFSVSLSTATGITGRRGTAALTANGSLSATGRAGHAGTAPLTFNVALTATGKTAHKGAAAPLAFTVTLSLDGHIPPPETGVVLKAGDLVYWGDLKVFKIMQGDVLVYSAPP